MITQLQKLFRVDFHENRIYGLDILRALAIISVLFGHGAIIIPGDTGSFYTNAYSFLDGVFVFFVLSGFLIGGLLIYTLEKKPITAKTLIHFWKMRLLRTLPAFYITLTVLIILSLLFVQNFDLLESLRYYFFIQNFDRSHPFFFAEAWTLSIEVWFYILIPLFIFIFSGFFKLSNKVSIIITVLFFIFFAFTIRWIRSFTPGLELYHFEHLFRKQVITRIDSVTFGVIGAYVYHYHKEFWLKYKNYFFVLGLILFLYTKYPLFSNSLFYTQVLFYDLQSISFLLVLPFMNEIKVGKGIVYKILTTLSYVSFSIYLLNLNIIQIFILNNIDFGSIEGVQLQIVKYILYLILSVFGGILMYKYVELPFMNLRKKVT